MASTLATPVAQAISLLFDGNLGRLLNYGLRPGYGLLGVWSPLTWFTNNEQGVWYDPSDFSTMFQDSAGTTPVTAVEQPVGLVLDKSKGLVLGAELVTNGTFDTDTGWTLTATAPNTNVITGGKMTLYRDATTPVAPYSEYVPATITAGKTYKVEFDSVTTTAGSNIGIGGGNAQFPLSFIGADGRKSFFFTATGTGTLRFTLGGAGPLTTSLDNISVKELPGNHATQGTSTKRPVLSARVNLLTKTEQFDNAIWVKSNTTVTANQAVAPDGTLTADKLIPTSGVAADSPIFVPGIAVNGSARLSIWAKAGEYNFLVLRFDTGASLATFNLTNGAIVNNDPSNVSASATEGANGYWFCSITKTIVTSVACRIGVSQTSALNTTGDGTSGIYIWGASLVPADQASLGYQRVNTATDYDTVGFKPYLKFDGVDDALVTNAIDFTATDKMTVVAGVRKLSDATTGTICELSSAWTTNAGSFALFASPSSAAAYGHRSNGTLNSASDSITFSAPITNVITQTSAISGDSLVGRVNGTQTTISASDQGTGNYGNYPLFIGARGGTALPFNGHLYSLIVRGAQSTDAQIVSAETYVNSKTGAY